MTVRIPIHVITGFLGSGKTTLIQKILMHSHSHDTLVLINEFGEVGLDDLLVKPILDNTYLLSSGCMCCTILDDVKQTLLQMLDLKKSGKITFSRIIIETTGLANPASILTTLHNDVHLKGSFGVHGMTAVVDSEFALQHRQHAEWLAQVSACQQVVISKTDRTDKPTQQKVKELVQSLNPDVDFVKPEQITDMNDLFARSLAARLAVPKFFSIAQQSIHNNTQSGVITFDKPVDLTWFGLWLSLLLNQHGTNILRMKGVIYLQNTPKPVVLQAVQHCLYPPEYHEDLWADKVSRLIFITRGLDVKDIKTSAKVFFGS